MACARRSPASRRRRRSCARPARRDMQLFRFQAVDGGGSVVTGEIEAASGEAAIAQLQSLGHFPTKVTAANAIGGFARWTSALELRRSATLRDLAMVTHEIATLLRAGLALDRAIELVSGLAET